jgi:hypothetical protein
MATSNRFRFPGKRADRIRCLEHIAGELARLQRTEESLAGYERSMLRGIREGGPDENVLASMHHWWEYDLEALLAKSTHPRPRIWVNILISRHSNLIVEWGPEGRETGQQGCDWKQWYRSGHYGAYRPSNELLFIRNVEFASFWFAKDYR